jgi:ABC-type multidrug transport system ATPase subunit
MIMGLVRPSYGDAEVLGHALNDGSPELRERVAYIAENHPLYGGSVVGDQM